MGIKATENRAQMRHNSHSHRLARRTRKPSTVSDQRRSFRPAAPARSVGSRAASTPQMAKAAPRVSRAMTQDRGTCS